jgi:hypothetical protein
VGEIGHYRRSGSEASRNGLLRKDILNKELEAVEIVRYKKYILRL